jgi:hypothetical protein
MTYETQTILEAFDCLYDALLKEKRTQANKDRLANLVEIAEWFAGIDLLDDSHDWQTWADQTRDDLMDRLNNNR